MEALIVEVRAGEGGADAKLLVEKQLMIYLRYAKRLELECELLRQEPGQVSLPGREPVGVVSWAGPWL
tara:strand:- start:1556 stop:1759 length:204 start_codon:yes stop_codon:yes gene_type:complete